MSVAEVIEVETTPTVIEVSTSTTDVVEVLEARGAPGPAGVPGEQGPAGGLQGKSGTVLPIEFDASGVASVSFDTPFANADYAVSPMAVSLLSEFAPTARQKTASGFELYLGSSQLSGLVEVTWIAIPHGET